MKQEIEQKELGMRNFQGYPSLLRQIKHRVSFAQQKAMYAANEELLRMNWDIGFWVSSSRYGRANSSNIAGENMAEVSH